MTSSPNRQAVKRKGNATKENLTWKINVLAAKVGEDTHIEQAKVAAFGKKQQTEPIQNDDADQEKLLMELNQVKKKKLEAKLVSRKAITTREQCTYSPSFLVSPSKGNQDWT
jgi:copper oxidase (laccase) domain-containing protein